MQSTTTAIVNTASSVTPAASTVSVAMDTTTDSVAPSSSSSSSSSSSFSSAAAAAAASASSSSSSSVGGGVLAYAVTSLVLTDESMALRLCAEPLASFGVVDLHFKTVPTAVVKSLAASIALVDRLARAGCVRRFVLDPICVASPHFTLVMAMDVFVALTLSAKVAPGERCCALETLDLTKCRPTWHSVADHDLWHEIVCRAIKLCGPAGLVSLSLNRCSFTDRALAFLTQALQATSGSLRVFDFSYNPEISAVGAASLIAIVARTPTMTTFKFVEGAFSKAAGKLLGASLAEPTHSLTELVLMDCNMDDAAAVKLAHGVAQSRRLAALNVGANKFGEKGASALFGAVGMCPTMETLECTCMWQMIPSRSIRVLADSLSRPTSRVREVDLACIGVTTEGSRFLGEALTKNTSLGKLSLYNNCIDELDDAFARGIRATTSLWKLKLSHGRLGDKGLCALADAVTENRSLIEVDVAVNGALEQRTLARLVAALKGNATMQTLTVGNREFGLTTESEMIAELAHIPAHKGLVFCAMNC